MEDLEGILETGGALAVEIAASALAEKNGTRVECANCKSPLIGPYCAICGQPHNTHRRTIGHLLHDFVKDVVNFDSRILRTARALLFQPGELPRAFHDGRTQRYMPAVRLYLFVSLIFFLFLSASGIAIMQFEITTTPVRYVAGKGGSVFVIENGKQRLAEGYKADAAGNISVGDEGEKPVTLHDLKADGKPHTLIGSRTTFFQPRSAHPAVPDAAARARLARVSTELRKDAGKTRLGWVLLGIDTTLQKLEKDPAALNGPLMTWIPRILFLLLPLFAILLTVFYWGRRKEYYFVDHLVFSLNVHTFGFVVLIAAAAAAQAVAGSLVINLAMLVMAVYLFFSLKVFYRQSWFMTGLKFVGIAFIYTVFFLLPALGFAIVASVVAG